MKVYKAYPAYRGVFQGHTTDDPDECEYEQMCARCGSSVADHCGGIGLSDGRDYRLCEKCFGVVLPILVSGHIHGLMIHEGWNKNDMERFERQQEALFHKFINKNKNFSRN